MYQKKTLYPVIMVLVLILWGCASDRNKVESFISEANAYYENQEYDKALIQLKNAIKLMPQSIEAHGLLAKTYLKLKNGPDAYKTYLRLEQLDPDNMDIKIEVAAFKILAKEFTEAETRVNQVLETHPDHIKALYLNAALQGRTSQDPDGVIHIYNQILDLDPEQTRAHFTLAGIYMGQGKKDKAEAHLAAARKLEPANIRIYRAMYGLYLSRKEPDKAEALLKEFAAAMPDKAEPLVMLGSHYMSLGDNEAAVSTLKQAAQAEPGSIKPHIALARIYNAAGSADLAETHIQKAVALDPDNDELTLFHADFYFTRGNFSESERLVDQILANRPGYNPAKALKGRLLIRKRDYQGAATLFRELVADEPGSAGYNFLLGNALYLARDIQKALPYISRTLELNPDHIPARMIMASTHYQNRDYFLAETELQYILDKKPADYNANLVKGNIHAAQREFSKAAAVYKKLLDIDPKNPAAYYRLGLVARAKGERDQARKYLNAALELNPMLMDVFSALIGTYVDQRMYDLAIQTCDRHMETVRDAPVAVSIALNLKANLLLVTQNPDLAKKSLRASIEKNPAYISPYLTLARRLASEGDLDGAVKLYKALIDNRPGQASPHSLLATLYEKKGEHALAETHYKQALEIDPDHVPALNNLAFLYAEQDKELNKALELAKQARAKTGAVTAVMDTLGWVYYKKELYPSAASEFEACVEQEPDNPVFHYHLGLAYNKMWKYEQAKAALTRALELQPDFTGSDKAREVLAQL